jgi:hypothetical protein
MKGDALCSLAETKKSDILPTFESPYSIPIGTREAKTTQSTTRMRRFAPSTEYKRKRSAKDGTNVGLDRNEIADAVAHFLEEYFTTSHPADTCRITKLNALN